MTDTAVAPVELWLRQARRSHELGRPDDAARLYGRVLACDPTRADVVHLLGLAQLELGRVAEGIHAFALSLRLRPDVAQVEHDLGGALLSAGHIERALAHLERAAALEPRLVVAHINRAVGLAKLGREGEAAAALEHALALSPGHPEALYRLGRVRAGGGEREAAKEAYLACLAAAPDHAEARYHLGDLQLAEGKFADGWRNYEARWRRGGNAVPARPFDARAWDGAPLAGRSILVWGEQGVGEEIMFASALPQLAAAAREVVVECAPRLVPLFARSFPGIEAVGRRTPPDPRAAAAKVDVQCALGSLCRWLRPSADAFRPRAYLLPDPTEVAVIRARYAALGDGLKLGIAWRSKGANRRYSAAKSSPLAAWRPLLAHAEAIFVNLQYGDCAGDLAEVEREIGVRVFDDPEVDQMASLDDFASQIAALDLVITTSNTTAHMAGALGIETWVLLPMRADWRWQRGREDSIWYPRARLFRQDRAGDWDGVLERAAAALRER